MNSGAQLMQRLLIIACMALIVVALSTLFHTQDQADVHAGFAAAQTKRDVINKMADQWSGEISFGATYSALAPMSDNANATTATSFDPGDEFWGLPRTEGVESVSLFCGSCHSLAIVMQQRQTPDGWRYLLDWMVEKQGMAPLHVDDRDVIHSYLSREFGAL